MRGFWRILTTSVAIIATCVAAGACGGSSDASGSPDIKSSHDKVSMQVKECTYRSGSQLPELLVSVAVENRNSFDVKVDAEVELKNGQSGFIYASVPATKGSFKGTIEESESIELTRPSVGVFGPLEADQEFLRASGVLDNGAILEKAFKCDTWIRAISFEARPD